MFKIEYEENGIQRQPIYSSDIRDVGQILINIANDERVENEAMQWCGQANWGDNFVNQKYRFSIQCVYDEKHVLKPGTPVSKLYSNAKTASVSGNKSLHYSTTNKAIVLNVMKAINYSKKTNMNKEYHLRIYDDGCWWIDLERFPSGQIRFWVGFEDKRSGNCRQSLATVFRRLKSNELYYEVDGIRLKKSVESKLLSTAVALEKAGLMIL